MENLINYPKLPHLTVRKIHVDKYRGGGQKVIKKTVHVVHELCRFQIFLNIVIYRKSMNYNEMSKYFFASQTQFQNSKKNFCI